MKGIWPFRHLGLNSGRSSSPSSYGLRCQAMRRGAWTPVPLELQQFPRGSGPGRAPRSSTCASVANQRPRPRRAGDIVAVLDPKTARPDGGSFS
jgi:hypothetical protein